MSKPPVQIIIYEAQGDMIVANRMKADLDDVTDKVDFLVRIEPPDAAD